MAGIPFLHLPVGVFGPQHRDQGWMQQLQSGCRSCRDCSSLGRAHQLPYGTLAGS
jgi:hypothetical protein